MLGGGGVRRLKLTMNKARLVIAVLYQPLEPGYGISCGLANINYRSYSEKNRGLVSYRNRVSFDIAYRKRDEM